jgi:uncharacterized small protein (DUF1192 family)
MLHLMTETRALSYIELAKAFDMTVPSARNMVRKRCWTRILSNDGKTVRIMVPIEELPTPEASNDKPPDAPPGDAPDASLSASLAILANHIERLQSEIEPLRATAAEVPALNAALDASRDEASRLRHEREAACEQAIALRISIAGLEATCAALRDEIERRESRGWWRRLTRR